MHPQKSIEKLMVPSESATQDLSNEWSYQYVSTILNLDNFCVLHLVTEVTNKSKRCLISGKIHSLYQHIVRLK
jgi:hypothetical protein